MAANRGEHAQDYRTSQSFLTACWWPAAIRPIPPRRSQRQARKLPL